MDPTNSLRQSRWRARRKAELVQLRKARAAAAAEVAALKQELAAAQARIAELEKTGAAKPQRPRRRKPQSGLDFR